MGGYGPTVPSSRTDLLLAGRYRLGAGLGTGGMADVYEAVDERLERTVAVKILRPEMAVRADVRQRFEAEARSAASLTHPNVVGVFDSGEDGEIPFLVMEKLPGETLADRMRDGQQDTDWILRVAGDVLGALAAAHAAGIVHRDVKPGNILIAADGCAKVADFGIAKSLEVAAAADLTSTNQLVGTPAYVAPERILGQPATVQADLYAVGVVLYEALAGTKPFEGNTPVATAYAIQHQTPPPLAEVRPDLPAPLVAAVERAMARDPGERFASADDMAAALRTAADAAAPLAADATIAMPVDATSVMPAAAFAPIGSPPPAPPAVAVATAPMGRPPWLRLDRRPLAIAVGAVLLVLALLGVAAATGDDDTVAGTDPARAELAAALRREAASLDVEGDGSAAPTAAGEIERVAAAVEVGGGATEATALLGALAGWRDRGELTTDAVDRVAALLNDVPGVDPSALTPPTTIAPTTVPADEDDKDDKDDKDEDEKKEREREEKRRAKEQDDDD